MENPLQLKIHRQVYGRLLDRRVTFAQILKDNEAGYDLTSAIFNLHSSHGGSPHVRDIAIDYQTVSFDITTMTGSFESSAVVEFYYSCDNMNSEITDHSRWGVTYNKSNDTFNFEPPDHWELDN